MGSAYPKHTQVGSTLMLQLLRTGSTEIQSSWTNSSGWSRKGRWFSQMSLFVQRVGFLAGSLHETLSWEKSCELFSLAVQMPILLPFWRTCHEVCHPIFLILPTAAFRGHPNIFSLIYRGESSGLYRDRPETHTQELAWSQ